MNKQTNKQLRNKLCKHCFLFSPSSALPEPEHSLLPSIYLFLSFLLIRLYAKQIYLSFSMFNKLSKQKNGDHVDFPIKTIPQFI